MELEKASPLRVIRVGLRSKKATPNLEGLTWLSLFILLIPLFGLFSGDHGAGNSSRGGYRSAAEPNRNDSRAYKLGWGDSHSARSCDESGSGIDSGGCCSLGSNSSGRGCNTKGNADRTECSGREIRKRNLVLPLGEHQ